MSFNLASLFELTVHIIPHSKCVRGYLKIQKLRATLYNTGVHMQTLWEKEAAPGCTTWAFEELKVPAIRHVQITVCQSPSLAGHTVIRADHLALLGPPHTLSSKVIHGAASTKT